MEIQGTIILISERQQISDSFTKREFVIQYAENPQYPEVIKFECIQDKCDLLDNYTVGQEVVVSFNLKGRKWTNLEQEDRYFNTLQAWRISDVAGSIPSVPQAEAAPEGAKFPDDESDSLPF